MHKANGAPTPHPRCILSWNSRNLSKQLLVVAWGVSFLVDLGPGAAVGGMRLEKNIRYSHPWAISFFSTRYDIDTI